MEFGELPKLVRDKIPEIAEENNHKPTYYKAEDEELTEKVLDKICEEAIELREDEDPEELADLLEVIEKFIEISDFTREDVKQIRKIKNKDKGGFTENFVLKDSNYSR